MAVEQGKEVATTKDKPLVEQVKDKVALFQEKGEIDFPRDYSVGNAIQSAWLKMQEAVDKDGRPALETCTKNSIANALLDTVVLGLSPAKEQCYYIVHGKKLCLRRSYFGTEAICKRVAGAKDIFSEVVYEEDDFEYEIIRNKKKVTKHTQKLSNIHKDKIVAAYCIIEWSDDKEDDVEIMTIEQIKAAWAMSPINNKARAEFPDQMAKRTVINRACKQPINSSSDNDLFLQSFNRGSEEYLEAEVEAEIVENANKQVLEIGNAPEVDESTLAVGVTDQDTGEPPF